MASGMADEFVTIPMVGFTESLNLSVSGCPFLHNLTARLDPESTLPWKLAPNPKTYRLNCMAQKLHQPLCPH